MINGFTRIFGSVGFAVLAVWGSEVLAQQPAPPSAPPFTPVPAARPPVPGGVPGQGPPSAIPPRPGPGAGMPRPASVPPPGAVAPTTAGNANGGISVQFPASPLSDVLDLYQQLIGKRIIRDPHLENATVTIETSGEMSKAEAIEFLENSLLLAGYAVVPSGDSMVKVIAYEAGRNPSSERVPMILNERDLPKIDTVVSYRLPLEYLKSEEAAQAFVQIIPVHPYGKLVAVPNNHALIIVENSTTIRAYIDLARQVDVPPSETKKAIIQLERADAEDVAKDLAELLGISAGATSGTSGGGRSGGGANNNNNRVSVKIQQPTPPAQPGMPVAPTPANPVSSVGESEAPPPKIQAISRTNSLLVIARPVEIEYIKSLVADFDAPSNTRGFVSRKMKYMDVVDFASVSKDALLRGAKDQTGGDSKLKGAEDTKSTTTPTQPTNNNQFGGGGGSYGSAGLFGGGGGGGSGGFSGFSGGSSLQETQTPKTQSMFIGKTLLIVDPGSSIFYASGPPEQLRMLESLADELDIRPQQILISAIIGSFTLTNDFQFGLDWVRTLETFGTTGSSVAGTVNTSGTKPVDFTSFAKVSDFPSASGLQVYGQLGKYANVFLNTLQDSKRFHVLQRPWVSTVNHKLATISTGQQIAIAGQTYSTGTTTTNTAGIYSTTQYIPVELRLDIIPHIYSNNEVKLEFNQTNNDVSGFTTISGNQVPNLSTQSLKNTIIVPDGNTILLGGLITQRDTDNQTGLPILSRIPVLKYLFSSTTKNKERDELLIFVQPHIISSGGDLVQDQADIEKMVRSYPTTDHFIRTGETPPDKKRAKDSRAKKIPIGSINTNTDPNSGSSSNPTTNDQDLGSRFGK